MDLELQLLKIQNRIFVIYGDITQKAFQRVGQGC